MFVSLLVGALFQMESLFLTLRRIYFLQCSSLGGVDLFDPEACEFIFYSAVSLLMGALMRWSRCCGPRGSFFVSLDVGALM